jgi:hypothetical protein
MINFTPHWKLPAETVRAMFTEFFGAGEYDEWTLDVMMPEFGQNMQLADITGEEYFVTPCVAPEFCEHFKLHYPAEEAVLVNHEYFVRVKAIGKRPANDLERQAVTEELMETYKKLEATPKTDLRLRAAYHALAEHWRLEEICMQP